MLKVMRLPYLTFLAKVLNLCLMYVWHSLKNAALPLLSGHCKFCRTVAVKYSGPRAQQLVVQVRRD